MPRSLHSHPQLCPLCRQANQCAVAQGQPGEGCWCMQQSIPAAALAAIAPEQRRQSCICSACAQAFSPLLPRESLLCANSLE